MELTDLFKQIQPLEAAAVELVRYQGLDPYEQVAFKHPKGYAVALLAPQWKTEAVAILRHMQIEACVEMCPPDTDVPLLAERIARIEGLLDALSGSNDK